MLESEWQEEKTPSSRVKLVEAQVYDMKCNENSNMEGESNIFLLDEVILRPLDNINSSNENKNFLSEIDNTLQQLRKWQLKREENSHDDMIDESIHRTRTTFLPSDNDLSETHEIHRANQETSRETCMSDLLSAEDKLLKESLAFESDVSSLEALLRGFGSDLDDLLLATEDSSTSGMRK